MNEIECPYCEHSFDLNHDDNAYYDEENRAEAECPSCEKNFMVTSWMSWSFTGEKADCLNGGEHDWRKRYNEKHYPELANQEECRMCDKKRTL